ncbi:MAG: Gfo/Idh/MocA family oxidoreductase [Chloroflexi bacterium]|nr:Gfo/Idh/MocA family oxidoreductase [Chloroflexota bacterium]
MAAQDTVRIGIVGAGAMAQQHLKGLGAMPDVKLVAFCDVVLGKAEELARQYGAAVYADPARMVDEVELDGIYILLPPFAHGSAEMAAIGRRIPFFVEKPIGNELGRCQEIATMVAEAGILTAVGYMNRYRQGVRRVREVLRSDPAVLACGGWIGGTPRPRPDRAILSWWVRRDRSGGQLVEQVTHTVDLVRYLLGEAVEVFAHAAPPRTFNRDVPEAYDIDDATLVSLRFASGAVASIYGTCAANAGGGVSLNVFAGRHSAYFTGWDHSLRLVSVDDAGQKAEESIPGEPSIFAIEDRAFVDAVKAGDPGLIGASYADGLKATEITLGALRSITTGRPVALV